MYAIATILMMTGNGLSLAATWYCKFVARYLNGEFSNNYGIWLIENKRTNACYLLDPDDLGAIEIWYTDYYLTAARACGTASNIMAFFAWIVMWCGFCCGCTSSKCFRISFGFVGLACATLTGLLFLIFQSSFPCGDYFHRNGNEGGDEVECRLEAAGVMAIISVVLFFLSGIMCCCIPDPDGYKD